MSARFMRRKTIFIDMTESGRPAFIPGKTNGCFGARYLGLVEDGQCGLRERDPVLAPGLHALARNDPEPVLAVDLVPPRSQHLAGPRGRQDAELQRPGRDAIPPPQLAMNSGMPSMASAAWWPRVRRLRGSRWARFPRHCAGFSPERRPFAFAASRTFSIRPRRR